MAGGFKRVLRTDKFKSDYKSLAVDHQLAVDECLKDLVKDPIPAMRRLHVVSRGRPKIFTVDVYQRKSHKISLEIDGDTLTLRRVGTHKQIDDRP